MNPTQLRHLLAVAEHGSLSRAATRMNITEPALSKSIRTLERTLGVELMDRTPRGMVPTVYGDALLAHARIIRAELNLADKAISEIRGISRGHVAIGSGPAFAEALLPTACLRFMARHPGVRLSVFAELIDRLLDRLLAGEIDFIVTMLGEIPLPPECEVTEIARDRGAVLARAEHPMAKTTRLRLDDLLDAAWILPKRPDGVRAWFDGRFQAAGMDPPWPLIEYGAVGFARAMLLRSDLLAFIPCQWLDHEISTGRLVELPAADFRWERRIAIVERRNSTRPPAVAAMIKEIERTARGSPAV